MPLRLVESSSLMEFRCARIGDIFRCIDQVYIKITLVGVPGNDASGYNAVNIADGRLKYVHETVKVHILPVGTQIEVC